jgi:signal transduction histidine kinase
VSDGEAADEVLSQLEHGKENLVRGLSVLAMSETSLSEAVRILHLEDDARDAEIVEESLRAAGLDCHIVRVERQLDFEREVRTGDHHVILSDYRLPGYDGMAALAFVREHRPEVPFILVSGAVGEEAAVVALLDGATDYVLKDHLSRLVPSLQRVLREAAEQRARKRAEAALLSSEERHRLERQLQQAQKLEAVGQLAAGIAHELNTPAQFVGDNLAFIRDSFLAMLEVNQAYRKLREQVEKEGGLEHEIAAIHAAEEAADFAYIEENLPTALASAEDGISRMSSIVRAMKEFAHPDRNESDYADLNRAIEATLTIARNEYKYVADVVVELGPLPPVLCRIGELNQVFLNLVINAAHAIADRIAVEGGRGRICVRSRQVDDSTVQVEVEDTGCGIPAAIRERVFEPFFTTKEVGRGSGQGLAIARSIIVGKHGGSLTFESEAGRGTTFSIALPIAGLQPREPEVASVH